MCEVRLAQFTRVVLLRKEHFPRGTFQRSPVLDPALQRSQLAFLEPAWLALLQILEERLGLQPGINLQKLFKLIPDIRKRIRPSAPGVFSLHLARQPSRSQVVSGSLCIHARLRCRYF